MAFTTTTLWEVESGGDDTNNGGGFDPGNANFATDLAATTATGVPVCTSASYNFVAGDVGAWLFIKSGTNWIPGWYQIASVATNAATLTATVGSAQLYGGATFLNTAVGCATTASPTGGTWGVDYSQSGATPISFTDMVIDGTTNTKFTSAAHPVGKNYVGNVISVTAGTGFSVQRVMVISTVTTTATCDKSLGTLSSTGGTGKLGGALASPGLAMTQVNTVASNSSTIWIGAGTYALSNTANGSGGKLTQTVTGANANNPSRIVGYNTIRGDFTGARPVLSIATSSAKIIEIGPSGSGGFIDIDFLEFQKSAGATSVTGVYNTNGGGNNRIRRCYFNAIATGINLNNSGGHRVVSCAASACTATSFTANGSSSSIWYGCAAYNGATAGFLGGTSAHIHDSVAYNISGPGFSTGWNGVFNCVAYGQTGSSGTGFSSTAPHYNCVAYGNNKNGFDNAGAGGGTELHNCAGGNNLANYTASDFPLIWNDGFVTLTADPFTSAAGLDFSLNSTAGGGPLLKAAGFNPAPQGMVGVSYPDIGAYQTQGGGGGSTIFAMEG